MIETEVKNYGGTQPFDMDAIIKYLEDTTEESWCTDVVKTKSGKNCLYGHLFDYGGSRVMDAFEECIATTYMFYPVNDGTHPDYPQSSPKQRILAYIKDIVSGKQKSTQRLMDEEYENWKSQ